MGRARAGTPPPPGYGYPPAPETETEAVVALVLSVVAWTFCPVVPAVVALVLAGRAETVIRLAGGRKDGLGLVKAARIISWVHLGLVGVGLVLLLLVIGLSSAGSA
jgi:hypothetical protein